MIWWHFLLILLLMAVLLSAALGVSSAFDWLIHTFRRWRGSPDNRPRRDEGCPKCGASMMSDSIALFSSTLSILVETKCYICPGNLRQVFDDGTIEYQHYLQELKEWIVVSDGGSVGPA